jgi:hypothetical protein
MTARIYIEIDENGTGGLHFEYEVNCDDATHPETQAAWATFHVAQFVGDIEQDLGEYQLPLGQVVRHYLRQGNDTHTRRN